MKTELLDEIKYSVKNWWMSLVLGIFFIGFAMLLMFQPVDAFVALSVMFSICIFASGVAEIIFAVTNKQILSGWGWYLACGILDLLIGVVLIGLPAVAMAMIPMLIAFWLMFKGFSAVGFAFDLKNYGSHNWGWYLAFGVLSVICSIGIVFVPSVGALTAVYIVAFSFLFIGMFRIMLSFDLKDLKDNSEKLKEKIKEFKKFS